MRTDTVKFKITTKEIGMTTYSPITWTKSGKVALKKLIISSCLDKKNVLE